MDTIGVIILEWKNRQIQIYLKDVLKLIPDGEQYNWGILWWDAIYTEPFQGNDVEDYKEHSAIDDGYKITWSDLQKLSETVHQIIDGTIIGCRNKMMFVNTPQKKNCMKHAILLLSPLTLAFGIFLQKTNNSTKIYVKIIPLKQL